jgi:hypothetical protein
MRFMQLDRTYHGHGILFRFPEGWELIEEEREEALMISVSDAGPFWSVTILRHRPRAERVLKEACQAFRDEYEDVDEYDIQGTVGGQPVPARDLEFVSLELINFVSMRAVEAGGKTLFVMAQVTDHEREAYEPVFQAINDSLKCDDDERTLSE